MALDSRTVRKWVIGVIVGLMLLIGAAWLLVSSAYSRKPLDDYVAKLKATRRPVTVTEALGEPPSTDVNGAPIIVAAWRALEARKGEPDAWNVAVPWHTMDEGGWWKVRTSDELVALRAALADVKPLFDAVDAARAKPRFRLGGAAAEGAIEFGDAVGDLDNVVAVIAARAIVATDPIERLSATEQLSWIAARWECRGVLDEGFAALTMRRATEGVWNSLERGDVDASNARARLDGLLATSWLPRFGAVVRLERAQSIHMATSPDFDGFTYASPGAARPSQLDVLKERARELGKTWRRGESSAPHSPAHLVATLAAFEPLETVSTDSYARLTKAIAEAASHAPDQEDVEPFSGMARELVQTDACCRLARVALAVAEHRATHGDFPASLDDMKWAFPDGVPLDPYTDAPFVYEKTATGVRFASVGRLAEEPALDAATLREKCLVWELKR